MDPFGAVPHDMQLPRPLRDRFHLDAGTARRLLEGMAPDDAPAPYAPVARVLTAARGPLDAGPAALERLAGAVRAGDGAPTSHGGAVVVRLRSKSRLALVAAAAVGTLGLTAGLAAADMLPGAAQDVASDMLDNLGISVPGGDHADDHADERGRSGDHAPDVETSDAELPDAATHGSTVSDTARNTEATGADKGAEIADVASDGRSGAAGEAGNGATVPATPPVDAPPDGVPPVDTPPSSTPPSVVPPTGAVPSSTPPVSTPDGPPAP